MKKYIWVALISFFLGLLAAGYVLVYLPEKTAPKAGFLDKPASAMTPSLYAAPSSSPEVRTDLDFVKVVDRVGPAVVKIVAERKEKVRGFTFGPEDSPFDDFWNRFFGSPQEREQEVPATAQGSGFFLSDDGYLLTNYHIVENATKVTVTALEGEEYGAKVVGTDPRTDLALLKIEAKSLPYVDLGDSGQLKVGEWVLAIGNPFGLEHTVTAGIVSAKGRQLGMGANVPEYQDFIQTDAAINRGNSGGPLVSLQGQVVGITSNILAPAGGNIGLGFAIPSNLAKKVVVQLKEKGRVVRGKIGVIITPLTEDEKDAFKLKDKKGALVDSVEKGGPAEKAGIRQYDVIVEVNGEKVNDTNDLKLKIADVQPGQKVEVKVIRTDEKGNSKEMTFSVTVEESEPQEEKAQAESSDKDLGFTVRELSASLARRYGFQTQVGLVVVQVKRYSEAERKGLAVGDIILEVNRKKVETVGDMEKILKGAESGQVIILLVRREQDGESVERIVTLRVP